MHARIDTLRAWLRRGGVGVVSVAVALATIAIGGALPARRSLGTPPRLTTLDYSQEPFRGIDTLRSEFVADVLGRETVMALGADTRPSESVPATEAPRRMTSTERPGATPQPTATPRGLPLGGVFVPAKLNMTLVSDRAKVRPGEAIRYTIRIKNVGQQEYAGHIQLQAHTPLHTFYVGDSNCPPDQPPSGCIAGPVPGPGEGAHLPDIGITWTGTADADEDGAPRCGVPSRMTPDAEVCFFYDVRVSQGAPLGTKLPNHGHLSSNGRLVQTTDAFYVTVE